MTFPVRPGAAYPDPGCGPVYYDTDLDCWVITRADDLEKAALDTGVFSSRTTLGITDQVLRVTAEVFPDGMPDRRSPSMTNSDPPEHSRRRTLANRAFTPKAVQAHTRVIRDIVAELLDGIAERGQADIASDFSKPVSARVITQLLGMPAGFTAQLAGFIDARLALRNRTLNDAEILRYAKLHKTYCDELLAHIRGKLANPGEDLTSAFAAAYTERYGPSVHLDSELFSLLVAVVIGGQATTASLISNVIHQLALCPELRDAMTNDPTGLPRLVRESVRHRPPVLGTYRVTTREATVRGVTIPSGARVKMAWSSGSRDQSRFPDPDCFDPDRLSNRNHLSFGSGIHFCIGAPLAQLEAELAVEQLLQRLPRIRLDPDGTTEQTDNPLVWGLTRLDVIWDTL